MSAGIVTDAWRCPRCETRYVRDVGTCGQNLPFVCRERVQRVLAPTPEAIERACIAYDADWYDEKDQTPEGAATWDRMEQVLLAALDGDDSFAALLALARLILDRHYPEAVFTVTYDDDRDPGVQLVAAIRACERALAGRRAPALSDQGASNVAEPWRVKRAQDAASNVAPLSDHQAMPDEPGEGRNDGR